MKENVLLNEEFVDKFWVSDDLIDFEVKTLVSLGMIFPMVATFLADIESKMDISLENWYWWNGDIFGFYIENLEHFIPEDKDVGLVLIPS